MTTFLLLLKYFFWSVLCTLLQVVFLSVTKLLLEYNFRILFTPLLTRSSRYAPKCTNYFRSILYGMNLVSLCPCH